MLFSTPDFLLFFVIVIAVISIIRYRKFQHIFLLIASYFFFYYSSNYLIVLLLLSVLLDYYIAKEIFDCKNLLRKKILLVISLGVNLGLLGFFKYADFAIDQFNIFGNYINLSTEIPLLNLALPIGISFYTFQTISYTVDVYRGQLTPSRSLREFALFVSFFPQLVAGPIVRAKDFLPQLREKLEHSKNLSQLRLIVIKSGNFKLGITIMVFGFFKKLFFADNIAPFVDTIFTAPIGYDSFTILLATIGFGIQIYGDFSGYSDIAIGLALILGFKLPINFNKPYFAISPSDFWRRWHISLSSWLRDYLYIPLGGNKKSVPRIFSNLIIVMFLGGLWHGASWNFVIWGLLHGCYLSVHKSIQHFFPESKIPPLFKNKFFKIFSILITQYFVFLAWIPFRISDYDDMMYSITKYIFWDFQTNYLQILFTDHWFSILLIGAFIGLHFISYNISNLTNKIANMKIGYWIFILFTMMMLTLLFYDGNPNDFIYFRF